MKVALVNPPWTFEGSIYFGCREPHLPLELGYAKALLERAGHQAEIFDGQSPPSATADLADRIAGFGPEMTAITTAPSYLFWRCAPPELRVPLEMFRALGRRAGTLIVVGPHASTTPATTLAKLGAEAAVIGECEELLVALADTPRHRWGELSSIAFAEGGRTRVLPGGPYACDMTALPALRWDQARVDRHLHHHHRFDTTPEGRGAEIETSRGCPYHCTFCAKDNFRDRYRKRPLAVVLDELDALIAQGVRYVYFIDEIFVPDRPLLEALVSRDVLFGVQMRIDNYSREMLDLLGAAGCVSIEAGVESITPEGRSLLAKRCRMSTEELTALLVHARRRVPFVQANLLDSAADPAYEVRLWREKLKRHGVWSNEPVPLFPYPGSPEYTRRWGAPDDWAWERAHEHYLSEFHHFSDIQDERPLPLQSLERPR